ALGLDRADLVIRRRMVQKMEFLLRDSVVVDEPSDDQLGRYLAEHAETFWVPTKIGFRHVFVRGRDDSARLRVRDLSARLNRDGAGESLPGEPFARGHEFIAEPMADIERIFGRPFAAAVTAHSPGQWSPPIRSQFGWHSVWVEELAPGYLPELAEIRERVTERWWLAERARARAAALDELIGRYTVTIE
ncbi:MAG: peptidylprolyl isomerase, partial [Myxococcota bacterium]